MRQPCAVAISSFHSDNGFACSIHNAKIISDINFIGVEFILSPKKQSTCQIILYFCKELYD